MTIKHTVTESGSEQIGHFDYTVTYETSRIEDDDIDAIRDAAQQLLELRHLGSGVVRHVSVFVTKKKVVALAHYDDTDTPDGVAVAKEDLPGIASQLAAILTAFDSHP